MKNLGLPPETIIIRPPVEAYSLLIAVTGGCSWNNCVFCGTYRGIQDYAIRPLEEVLETIDYESSMYPNQRTIFLAGGNPTSAPTDYLCKIIRHVRKRFKYVQRVSCYSKALDIVRKTDEELRQLAEAGLDIVYMGLESGSNTVLRIMKKGTNDKTFIKVGRRLLAAGIKLSLYVLLGLGGYEHSAEHIKGTAHVLTEINPTVFRFRTLNVSPNIPLWNKLQSGEFTELNPVDTLREERDIIKLLGENVTSEVYNDHMNNYFPGATKNIQKDRELFINSLNKLIDNPKIQNLKPVMRLRM
jgi:radical SAM superfamily enzyme YgiQ (UPF0313 family)